MLLPQGQIYISDRFKALPSLDADVSSYRLVLQVPGRQEPLVGRLRRQALQHGKVHEVRDASHFTDVFKFGTVHHYVEGGVRLWDSIDTQRTKFLKRP